jgi:hypothetical protein
MRIVTSSILRLYSPAIWLVLWALVILAGVPDDSTVVVGRVGLAVMFVCSELERRRRKKGCQR